MLLFTTYMMTHAPYAIISLLPHYYVEPVIIERYADVLVMPLTPALCRLAMTRLPPHYCHAATI